MIAPWNIDSGGRVTLAVSDYHCKLELMASMLRRNDRECCFVGSCQPSDRL